MTPLTDSEIRNAALEEAAEACEKNSGEVARFVEAKGRIGDFFALLLRKMKDKDPADAEVVRLRKHVATLRFALVDARHFMRSPFPEELRQRIEKALASTLPDAAGGKGE